MMTEFRRFFHQIIARKIQSTSLPAMTGSGPCSIRESHPPRKTDIASSEQQRRRVVFSKGGDRKHGDHSKGGRLETASFIANWTMICMFELVF